MPITSDDFPALANFLTTWFTTDHDFDELPEVLALMRRLDALDNLREVQAEVRRLKATGVSLAEFNAFSQSLEGRTFTAARYEVFLDTVGSAPNHLMA